MTNGTIALNLVEIRARIGKACLTAGREPSEITIVGVSKTVTASIAGEAVKAGLKDLAENRLQEGIEKIGAVAPRPIWHFIGHLQRNKARKAAEYFDVIQSVDSFELAGILSRRCEEMGKELEIFIQLNSTDEAQKSGFNPAVISENADKINKLPGLKLRGLMTIGPFTDVTDTIKRSFDLTKNVFDKLKTEIGSPFYRLSMGMSGDFELALEYGANVLRIGTAIFGPRLKT